MSLRGTLCPAANGPKAFSISMISSWSFASPSAISLLCRPICAATIRSSVGMASQRRAGFASTPDHLSAPVVSAQKMPPEGRTIPIPVLLDWSTCSNTSPGVSSIVAPVVTNSPCQAKPELAGVSIELTFLHQHFQPFFCILLRLADSDGTLTRTTSDMILSFFSGRGSRPR